MIEAFLTIRFTTKITRALVVGRAHELLPTAKMSGQVAGVARKRKSVVCTLMRSLRKLRSIPTYRSAA